MNAFLESLSSAFKKGRVHVVGRTNYRSARVKEDIFECDREEFAFMEDLLKSKDNHVVLIFQIIGDGDGWETGLYYAFLHDFYCVVGRKIVIEAS